MVAGERFTVERGRRGSIFICDTREEARVVCRFERDFRRFGYTDQADRACELQAQICADALNAEHERREAQKQGGEPRGN